MTIEAMCFEDVVAEAKRRTAGYTPAAVILGFGAAIGEIANTFATPIGVPGDGRALVHAVGKSAVCALGAAYVLGCDLTEIEEPSFVGPSNRCAEDIVASLLEHAGLVANLHASDRAGLLAKSYASATSTGAAYALAQLSALLQPVGGPSLTKACAIFARLNFIQPPTRNNQCHIPF